MMNQSYVINNDNESIIEESKSKKQFFHLKDELNNNLKSGYGKRLNNNGNSIMRRSRDQRSTKNKIGANRISIDTSTTRSTLLDKEQYKKYGGSKMITYKRKGSICTRTSVDSKENGQKNNEFSELLSYIKVENGECN